ncbi:MAG TPA: hypothetical protein VH720_14885 [Candidatus Limnocylindrales bacterium]|jgi:hypothetical protein
MEPVEPGGGLEFERQRLSHSPRGVWPVIVAGLAVVGVALVGGRFGASGTTTASASPSPTRPARPTIRPPDRRPPPGLPPLANQVLPFPGTLALFRRNGAELDVLTWASGDPGFRTFARMPDVLPEPDAQQGVGADLSPDGRLALIFSVDQSSGSDLFIAQLRSVDDGGLVWESEPLQRFSPPLWARDSQAVAIAAPGGPWLVVARDEAGEVREHTIPLAGQEGAADWTPVGFSRDHRWLYAAISEAESLHPAWRVEVATGKRQVLDRFALTGPGGLVPDGGTPVLVDPFNGRLVGRYGGESAVDVFEPDGSPAFSVPVTTNQGLAWTEDGGLVVLETQGEVRSGATRLSVVDIAGHRGDPVWEYPAVQAVGLLGVRHGHAVMFVAADFEAGDVWIGLVRLGDGATSAIRPDPAIINATIGIDWFEPPG